MCKLVDKRFFSIKVVLYIKFCLFILMLSKFNRLFVFVFIGISFIFINIEVLINVKCKV